MSLTYSSPQSYTSKTNSLRILCCLVRQCFSFLYNILVYFYSFTFFKVFHWVTVSFLVRKMFCIFSTRPPKRFASASNPKLETIRPEHMQYKPNTQNWPMFMFASVLQYDQFFWLSSPVVVVDTTSVRPLLCNWVSVFGYATSIIKF